MKYETDKKGDRAVSNLLQQALDEVAVTKYLNNIENQENPDIQTSRLNKVQDIIEFDHDPLTEEDLALIQSEEDQMADLALTQRYDQAEE